MPLRSVRSGSTSRDAFTPQLTLVAHNGQLVNRRHSNTDPVAIAEQRRRSRRVAVLCFGAGLLILLAAASQMLAATQ